MKKLFQFNFGVYLCLFLLAFQGCNKNSDNEFPSVSIIKPFENQIFSVGDTIPIEVDIQYSSKIESVMITLTDANFVRVMRTYLVNLKTFSSQKIKFIYPLDDDFLESGNYNIEIVVVGNTNTKNKYAKVAIAGLPKLNLGLNVITKSADVVNLTYLDFQYKSKLQKTFAGNYISSSYLPYHNVFTFVGGQKGDATSFNYFNTNELWKIKNLNSDPTQYIIGSLAMDNLIQLFYFSSKVQTYNYNGNLKMVYSLTPNYFPTLSLQNGDNFVVYEKSKASVDLGKINVFFASTGKLMQSYALDYEAVYMSYKASNEIVIVGNKNGNAILKVYYLNDNNFWEPRSFSFGKLISMVQINPDIYLFIQNGILKRYRFSDNSLVELISFSNFNSIKYDEINQIVYAKSDHECASYSFPNLNKIHSEFFTDSIVEFQIIYNR
ncbi:MAG: hypothetical protein AUJ98_04530 [Bacteroidetes bacterium CG2_30_33_31]|nr:MAG: hypothetical protein AUJ98_04530 [Bacteroidetes bacterium CG2_30_33_31]